MKLLAIVLLVTVLSTGSVFADHIGLYADPTGLDCILENPPVATIFSVYVIHKFNQGSGASQFRVFDTSGFISTTQTTIAGLSLGQWNSDWSIAYGASCLVGELNVATLNFLYFGTPLTCANRLRIGDAPTSPIPGAIALVDCQGGFEVASGGDIPLGPVLCDCSCCLPIVESTWGSVKALYR